MQPPGRGRLLQQLFGRPSSKRDGLPIELARKSCVRHASTEEVQRCLVSKVRHQFPVMTEEQAGVTPKVDDLKIRFKLLEAKAASLTQDKVDLPAAIKVDNVEESLGTIRLQCSVAAQVVALLRKLFDELVQRAERRSNDDIYILRRARCTVECTREGTGQHVRNASRFECS